MQTFIKESLTLKFQRKITWSKSKKNILKLSSAREKKLSSQFIEEIKANSVIARRELSVHKCLVRLALSLSCSQN